MDKRISIRWKYFEAIYNYFTALYQVTYFVLRLTFGIYITIIRFVQICADGGSVLALHKILNSLLAYAVKGKKSEKNVKDKKGT